MTCKSVDCDDSYKNSITAGLKFHLKDHPEVASMRIYCLHICKDHIEFDVATSASLCF